MSDSAVVHRTLWKGPRRSWWQRFRPSLRWYPFIAVNFIIFTLFTLAPFVYMLDLTLFRWDMLTPRKFVGLGNYVEMSQDPLFRIALWNTVRYVLMDVPSVVAVSFMVALLVNRQMRGMKVFRAMYFLPNVTSIAVLAVIFWRFLSPRPDGPINYLIGLIGIPPQTWFVNTRLAMPSLVGISVWGAFGYYMVIWLAGLQGVPKELYEAAYVDGASGWRLHRYVTIPMIRPTAAFIIVTSTIGAPQVFGSIYLLTNGGPVNSTTTIVFLIYNRAFQFAQLGYASTVSLVLFLIVISITYLQGKYLRFGESVY